MNDLVIAREHPDMMQYVDALQKKFNAMIAFIPKAGIEKGIANRQILIAIVNGWPAGYLFHGAFRPDMVITQCAIEFDLQRQTYGLSLVQALMQEAAARGVRSMKARCGSDLDANRFWSAAGFVCIAHLHGASTRGRVLNVWEARITPGLFVPEQIVPFDKRSKKSSGHFSRFARPKKQLLRIGDLK
jgi:hypothetical protein